MSAEKFESLRRGLSDALASDDQTERLLEVAAVVSEALSELGAEPVVVGGLAMAYWSDGAYATADIDIVAERIAGFPETLEALGFAREGRTWLLDEAAIALEAPSAALEPGDRAEWADLPSGRRVRVLAPEDLLLWRIREWIYWRAASGFWQAAHLVESPAVDQGRLMLRADEEGLRPSLEELRRMTAEIANGRSFEAWELIEAADALRARDLESER